MPNYAYMPGYVPAAPATYAAFNAPNDYTSTLGNYTKPAPSGSIAWSDYINPRVDIPASQLSAMNASGAGIAGLPEYTTLGMDGSQVAPALAIAAPTTSWYDSLGQLAKDSGFLGYKDAATGNQVNGWGGLAVQGALGLGNLFMGMQQYNLAKDTLANNKAQFAKNYAAQRQATNTALEDRQRARVSANPNAYQSVSDYMAQHRIA